MDREIFSGLGLAILIMILTIGWIILLGGIIWSVIKNLI